MLRYILIRLVFIGFFAHVTVLIFGQNIGVGLLTPADKLQEQQVIIENQQQ